MCAYTHAPYAPLPKAMCRKQTSHAVSCSNLTVYWPKNIHSHNSHTHKRAEMAYLFPSRMSKIIQIRSARKSLSQFSANSGLATQILGMRIGFCGSLQSHDQRFVHGVQMKANPLHITGACQPRGDSLLPQNAVRQVPMVRPKEMLEP